MTSQLVTFANLYLTDLHQPCQSKQARNPIYLNGNGKQSQCSPKFYGSHKGVSLSKYLANDIHAVCPLHARLVITIPTTYFRVHAGILTLSALLTCPTQKLPSLGLILLFQCVLLYSLTHLISSRFLFLCYSAPPPL